MMRTTARGSVAVVVLTLLASLVGAVPAASADGQQISFGSEQKRRPSRPLDGAAVDGVTNGRLHVVGRGLIAGPFPSAVHEVLTLP
ncbi:hypothetical protein M3148_07335 [Georgenia satyanarayanai]|uniref:hypothetical protein n=1 Tax=Georgenia satyanarayanai TaxID=860221 RepID=UPI00203F63F1|nr:hypothetical protein [Georgenia satyanarayanai]MCM3660809.1 hypothetical protein [Georgenia satyanarayanai]